MPQKQTRRKPRRKGLQHPCPVGKDARGVTGAAEPAVPDAPGTEPEPPPSRARAHLEHRAPPAALRSAAPQGSRWNRAELGLLWCDFYPDGWDEASRGMAVMQSRAQASRLQRGHAAGAWALMELTACAPAFSELASLEAYLRFGNWSYFQFNSKYSLKGIL